MVMQRLALSVFLALAVFGAEGKERKAKVSTEAKASPPKASTEAKAASPKASTEAKASPSKASTSSVEPLVSTELFTRTYHFFGDFKEALATSGVYAQFTEWRESKGIAALDLAKVDLLQSLEDKAKHHGLNIPKSEAIKHMATVQGHANTVHGHVSTATSLVLEKSEGHRQQIFKHVESQANHFIDEFERFLPQHKGFISRHPADFVLFLLYMFVVVYAGYRVCWTSLKFVMRIFCLFFCCGMCHASKKTVGKSKNGAKATAKASAAKADSGKKKK